MKIKDYGMASLIEFRTMEENVMFCRTLGLKFLELNMNLPMAQLERLKTFDIPRDINITLHLPEELNVWDINKKIKISYLDFMAETIELALEKGIKKLNMHMNSGVYFTLPHGKVYLFDEYKEAFLKDTETFCELIKNLTFGTDLCLNIENTGIYGLNYITEALDFMLNYDCFNLTWDIGHDQTSEFMDSVYLLPRINRINHMHLHDGTGRKNHLPLGSGEIDIMGILSHFNTIPPCVLETKTSQGLIESVNYLTELGLIQNQ